MQEPRLGSRTQSNSGERRPGSTPGATRPAAAGCYVSPVWGVPRGDPDPPTPLWVNPSYHRRVGYALNGDCVCGEPHVDALVHRCVENLVEGPSDHVVELGVDLLLLPEECLEVLHPLEVGDDHAAGVGDDVWDHENSALVKDASASGATAALA